MQISRNQANNSSARHRLYKQNKNVYRLKRKRMVNWTVIYLAEIYFPAFRLTTPREKKATGDPEILPCILTIAPIVPWIVYNAPSSSRRRGLNGRQASIFQKSGNEIGRGRLQCIRHLSISAKVQESQYLRLKPVSRTPLLSVVPFSAASHALTSI